MKIGDKLSGTVVSIQSYGAFVEGEGGVVGLVHISEVQAGFIPNIHDLLTVGETLTVQVLDIDEFTGQVSFSIRTLEEEKHPFPRRYRFSTPSCHTGFSPLEKQLPTWIREALDALQKEKSQPTCHTPTTRKGVK